MIKLGQRLREMRLQKELSLDDVTKATKIRTSFLSAIERGEYQKLPSSSYAQGFVANYAQFLGFSKREALALFRREFDNTNAYKVLPDRFSDPAERTLPRFKIQQAWLGIILAFLVLLGYLGYAYKGAFINPQLRITSPTTNVAPGEITVIGTSEPYATVTINSAPVSVENDGTFTKKIIVFPGDVPITIKAKNRFGRETTVTKILQVRQ
jgi:cytoskeletal protein RodZ